MSSDPAPSARSFGSFGLGPGLGIRKIRELRDAVGKGNGREVNEDGDGAGPSTSSSSDPTPPMDPTVVKPRVKRLAGQTFVKKALRKEKNKGSHRITEKERSYSAPLASGV
jgi:hypothetical protein